MNEDIQFVRVGDFNADNKKLFYDADCKERVDNTIRGLPDKTSLMVSGVFGSPFKIKSVTPVTSDFIKNTLTI